MPKSQEENGTDGWTRICRGKKDRLPLVQGTSSIDRDMTLEKLAADFATKTKAWQRSSCRKEVLQILDRQQPDDGWQITKVICLASGSFSRDNWENRKRSVLQFAAFIDIARHLQASTSQRFEIFAQEPQYTELDVQFLATIAVTVPDFQREDFIVKGLGPTKVHLGSQTVVFEPFMDLDHVSMKDLLSSQPQLYIGSSLPDTVPRENEADLDSRDSLRTSRPSNGDHGLKQKPSKLTGNLGLVKQFHDDYRWYRFPRFEEDPNVFDGLKIYWKEAKDGEEED